MDWDMLINETAKRSGEAPERAAGVLNAFLDAVIDGMATDETIGLRGDFGSFEMRDSGGFRSMHERSIPKCRRTPVFKKSAALKKKLRQADADYIQMLRESGRETQAEMLSRKQTASGNSEK